MILRYYTWVSGIISRMNGNYWLRPSRFNPLGNFVVLLLVTWPIWITVVVINLLPISANGKFTLWMLTFVTVIVLALRTAYVLSKK